MQFSQFIKLTGIKALLKRFDNDLKQIREYLFIELNKKKGDDMSSYMKLFKDVLDNCSKEESVLYKNNILEIVEKLTEDNSNE